MVEFFADSLVNGFLQSSMMGKFIVMVQLSASIVMVGIIIGKVKMGRRVHDVAGIDVTFLFSLFEELLLNGI